MPTIIEKAQISTQGNIYMSNDIVYISSREIYFVTRYHYQQIINIIYFRQMFFMTHYQIYREHIWYLLLRVKCKIITSHHMTDTNKVIKSLVARAVLIISCPCI